MNNKENQSLRKIAKHTLILNREVGILQNDVRWIKKLLFIIIGLVSVAVGKVLFFGGI